MRNKEVGKYVWAWSFPAFALLLSISPQVYGGSQEFSQNDQHSFVPTVSVNQFLSQQPLQDTEQTTAAQIYDSPLSKVEASPLSQSLTAEERVQVQNLLADLESSIQEGQVDLRDLLPNPAAWDAAGTTNPSGEHKAEKHGTGIGNAEAHEKKQPVVNQLASLHDQLTELAVYLVRSGIRDIHTLIQKKYEMAREQVLEESFNEQIQTAELMSSEHLEKAGTQKNQISSGTAITGAASETYVKELAATVALFTPPRNVHPFLRLVFYRSDPRIVKAYRNVRQEAREFRESAQWRKDLSRSYRHETLITEHRSLPLVPEVFKRGRFLEKIFGTR